MTTLGPDSRVIPVSRVMMPASMSRMPMRTMRRGDGRGQSRGTPRAATSNAIDSGITRTPVAMADSARSTER